MTSHKILLLIILSFSYSSFSQNPLIYSFYHEEYYQIELIKYAEEKGKLDNRICQYLVSSNKLDNKLAVVDALLVNGEKTGNGELFEVFLENRYGLNSLFKDEDKFILAYLYSTTDYQKSNELLSEIEHIFENSLAFQLIKLMINIYHNNELNDASKNCDNWVEFQKIDLNKTLNLDLNKNSVNRIAEEINELKKYCDDKTLVITETQRNFNQIPERIIEKIELNEIGGVYSVPIEINKVLTLDFIYDSGASYVLLPEDVFRVLIRTKTVKKEDMLGFEKFSIADGSIIEKPVFILKELKIGNITVYDIKASVGNSDSELLLGQSFQKKFKKIRVDNYNKTLNIEEY